MVVQSGLTNFVEGNKNWRVSGRPRRVQWWLMIAVFLMALIQAPSLSQAQDASYFDLNASNILSTAKSFPVPSRYCSDEEKAYTTGFLSGQLERAKTLRQDVNAAYKGKQLSVAELSAKQAILTKIRNAISLLRQKLSKANRLKPEDCSDPGSISGIGGGTTKKGGVKGGGKDKETVSLPTLVPIIIPELPSRICTEQERNALLQRLTFARGVAQKNLQAVIRHDFGKSAAARTAKQGMINDAQTTLGVINSRIRVVQRMKLAPEEECKDPKSSNSGTGSGSGRLQTPSGAGQTEPTDETETPIPTGTESDPAPLPTEEDEVLVATPTPEPEPDELDKAIKELEETLDEMAGVGPSFEIPNEEPGEGTEENQEEGGTSESRTEPVSQTGITITAGPSEPNQEGSPPESESRTPEEEVEEEVAEEDPEGGGI